MTATFTAAVICEEALRDVGAYTPSDPGPDPAEYKVAVRRFDMLMAQLAGMTRFWWLTPKTQTLTVPANAETVPLADLPIPLQQVVQAKKVNAQNMETQVDLLHRSEWEAIDNRTQVGEICALYIERDQAADIYPYMIPREATTLRLFGYGFAPDIYATLGETAHQFAESFQLYLIKSLAYEIGGGAVRSMDANDRTLLMQEANRIWSLLNPNANRENLTRPRFTKPRQF